MRPEAGGKRAEGKLALHRGRQAKDRMLLVRISRLSGQAITCCANRAVRMPEIFVAEGPSYRSTKHDRGSAKIW